MSTYTQEQIDAVHELPLRKDVRWLDMSPMFPGKIIEENKRKFDEANPGDPAVGKWAGVNLNSTELAAATVAAHNEWLATQESHADRPV